ncbi:MAG: hypothetical protein IJY46_00705 [Lentisphaeria bacterium]|nr:hypothetical protein [Lentisphaeria bacterium]
MDEFDSKIAVLLEQETAYTADAYRFVADAVTYTVGNLPEHRHVTALELLKGARELAIKNYGAVACEVMREFGLHTASDVGKVVYLLISINLLSASEDDDLTDFDIDFAPVPALCEQEVAASETEFHTIID